MSTALSGTGRPKRLLFAIDKRRCPFGCTYCFAGFGTYGESIVLADVEADPSRLDGIDVVYPACDSDLFARSDYDSVLNRTAALGRSVSISTKAPIRSQHLDALAAATARLRGRGIIKVGVSISTKSRIAELEPRSGDYASRLRSLQLLRVAGVANCLVLRPLLAEVGFEEYEEILLDSVGLTDCVLLGDEWLDDPAREPNGTQPAEIRLERVNWLPGQPLWPKRVDLELHRSVAEVAKRLGFRTFESDLDVMADLLAAPEGGARACGIG